MATTLSKVPRGTVAKRRSANRPLVRLTLLLAVPALTSSSSTSCPRYAGRECSGHGTCNTAAAGGAKCVCEEGYGQSDCSWANFCPGDCGGHGKCIQPADHIKKRDPMVPGQCVCDAGFSGASCTTLTATSREMTPPSGCEGFCFGHGQCVCAAAKRKNITRTVRTFDARGRAGQDTTVTEEVRIDMEGKRTTATTVCGCSCHKGYMGLHCGETTGSNCPNACSGRGACGPGNACTCNRGFEGPDCSRASASACPAACSGHGACVVASGEVPMCNCHAGFSGKACDKLTLPPSPPPPVPPPPPSYPPPAEETMEGQKAANAAADATKSINASKWPQYVNTTVVRRAGNATSAANSSATPSAHRTSTVEDGVRAAAVSAKGWESGPSLAAVVGCSGHGYLARDGVSCVCADGFGGRYCEYLTFSCATPALSNCSGHGHCERGMCLCEEGAHGKACENVRVDTFNKDAGSRACIYSCSGHGRCAAKRCLCDAGFTGEACNELARRSSSRSSRGSWRGKVSSSDGDSSADEAADEQALKEALKQDSSPLLVSCPSSCSGHGRCLPLLPPQRRTASQGGAASRGRVAAVREPAGTSSSPDPYKVSEVPLPTLASRLLSRMGGHVVGEALPIAHPSPAISLVSAGGAVHACACEPGFTGSDCSVPQHLCPMNCSGAGLCAPPSFPASGAGIPTYVGDRRSSVARLSAPSCLCRKGYAGAGCEQRAASCPNGCSGRGRCVNSVFSGVTVATCKCAPGYTGASCEQECEGTCGSKGRCARVGGGTGASSLRCLCEAGWGGATCSEQARCPVNAAGIVCSGRGECHAGTCKCGAGFFGHDCSRDGRDHDSRVSSCPRHCMGHGSCIAGICACLAGFTGDDCSQGATILTYK